MKIRGFEIEGNLDIFVSHTEDEFEGKISKWDEILIHGDPEGLRSFAKLLNDIANLIKKKLMIMTFQLEQENIFI